MIRYYSSGGAKDPYFRYKVGVAAITEEMMSWCDNCPSNDFFERYYVNSLRSEFSFEAEEHAIMFRLRWS